MASRRKSSSRRRDDYYPTRWSDWKWNEQYQHDARYREVSEGEWEWEYAEPRPAEPYTSEVEPTPWTPRYRSADPHGALPRIDEHSPPYEELPPDINYRIDSGFSDITQGLAHATIDSSYQEPHYYQEDQQYSEERRYPEDTGSHGGDEKRRSKGKNVEARSDKQSYTWEEYAEHHAGGSDQDQHSVDYGGSQPEIVAEPELEFPPQQTDTSREYPSEYQGPHPASSQGYAGDGQYSEQSPSYNPTPSFGATPQWGGAASSSNRPPPQAQYNITIPRRMIRTRDPNRKMDELDARFKVHRSNDFKFGKVFKVLWSEPIGSGGTEITVPAKYGENAFHKIRRFLVVKNKPGHSICIPILTYGHQGVLKRGVHPQDHAVVYSSRKDGPYLHEREEGLMTKKSIRLEIKDPSHKLDPMSRLNYAKIYTVEHNVKVLFIGKVAENYEQAVVVAFNATHPPPKERPYPERSGSLGDYIRNAQQADPSYPNPIPIPETTSSTGWGTNTTQPYQGSYVASSAYPASPSYPNLSSYPDPSSYTESFPYPVANLYSPSGTQPYGISYSDNPQISPSGYQQPPPQEQYSHPTPTYKDRYEGGSPPKKQYGQYTIPAYDDGYDLDSFKGRKSMKKSESETIHPRVPPHTVVTPPTVPTSYSSTLVEAAPNIPIPSPPNVVEEPPSVHTPHSTNTAIAVPTSLDTVESSPNTSIPSSPKIAEARSSTAPPSSPDPVRTHAPVAVSYPPHTVEVPPPLFPAPKSPPPPKATSDEHLVSDQHTPPDLQDELLDSRPIISRKSSVASIASLVSIFSSSLSQSSVGSSVDGGDGGAQRLCDFLSTQEWLLKLSKDASEKVSIVKYENNLRRSLMRFAAHLREEAATPIMVETGSAIGRIARNTAILFRQSLESQAKSDEKTDRVGYRDDEVNWPNGDYKEEDPDDDDMYDVLDDKEGEGEEDPKNLELLLAKSVALQLLEENLRLFVHPDPVKRALFEIWPVIHHRSSPLPIEYDLEWEVPNFLRDFFPKGQELGKVLTVTGEAVNAQAQSCSDYLKQTWPEIGPSLLAALQRNLQPPGSKVGNEESHAVSFKIKLLSNPDSQGLVSSASLVVLASHAIHEQVASALAWITASVRHSPHENIFFSKVSVLASKSSSTPKNIAIRMAELEEIPRDQACWHSLLPHAVVAQGFPIRGRTAGKGLEISFPGMAMLSQSMSFTEHDDGFIVEGLRSVLIPMEVLSQDMAIQWHLEYKRQTKQPELRTISEIFAVLPNSTWYKSQQPDELFQKKCFLGWVEEVAVMIGTEQFSTPDVFPSRAKLNRKTYHSNKSKGISISTSGLVGISANASMAWQTSKPSRSTWDRFKGIRDTLSDEHRLSLLIYDTDQQIGWLLPRLSVILYLTNKIFARREETGYRLHSGDKETAFKHAKPKADGASAAYSALDELLLLEIRKSKLSEDRDPFYETIEQVIFVLDKARDVLDSANTESEQNGSNLYGVELNDLLDLKPPIDVKYIHIHQPWTQMVRSKNCGLVLFCRGFGQPIIPTSPQRSCPSYKAVPPERCLLATTGTVLHTFVKTHHNGPEGATLGDTVEWVCEGGCLVQSHVDGQSKPIYHEQNLLNVKNSNPNRVLLDSVSRFMSGGFIFTDRSRKPCSEVIAPMQSGFLNAVRHSFGETSTPLPEPPEDDSSTENSNESDAGFNPEHLPTSSISSDESPQVEKEQDQSIVQRLLRSTVARTGDLANSRKDTEYVTVPSPSEQLPPTSSSSSSTPRGLKKRVGCLNLGDFVDRGKGQVSGNKACDERGREMPVGSDLPRTVTTAPTRQAQNNGKRREVS